MFIVISGYYYRRYYIFRKWLHRFTAMGTITVAVIEIFFVIAAILKNKLPKNLISVHK